MGISRFTCTAFTNNIEQGTQNYEFRAASPIIHHSLPAGLIVRCSSNTGIASDACKRKSIKYRSFCLDRDLPTACTLAIARAASRRHAQNEPKNQEPY
jgi:hypothetical protein